MPWFCDGLNIEQIFPDDDTDEAPPPAPWTGGHPSRHFPGHRLSKGEDAPAPSATHGRYPGHRRAVKRWERESGEGRRRVGKLADVRKKFKEELDKDPKTKQELWDLVDAEVGEEHEKTKTAFIETVMNRAAARGQTLKHAIHSGYYAGASMRKVGRGGGAAEEKSLQNAYEGSNVSHFSTGNSSGNVGFNKGPQQIESEGERFGIEGPDVGWAREMARGADGAGGGNETTFRSSGPVHIPTQAGKDSEHLEPEFKARLNSLYDAAPEDVKRHLSIGSGYRSHAHQAELYSKSGGSGMVARPGHSQHEAGRAVDLHFGSDRAKQWVHEHAGEHGLSFPMGFEPWHIEPDYARGGGSRKPIAPPKTGAERAREWEHELNKTTPAREWERHLNATPIASIGPHFPRGPFPHTESEESLRKRMEGNETYGVGSRWGFDPNVQWALGKHPLQRRLNELWHNRVPPDTSHAGKVEIDPKDYKGDPNINRDSGGVGFESFTEGKTFKGPEGMQGWTQREGETLQAPNWTVEPGTEPDTPSNTRVPMPRPRPPSKRPRPPYLRGPYTKHRK